MKTFVQGLIMAALAPFIAIGIVVAMYRWGLEAGASLVAALSDWAS